MNIRLNLKLFFLGFTVLLLIVLICINVYAAYYSIVSTKIYLHGSEIKLENKIVTIDGNMYVPLRECFEEMGYDVNWDKDNKIINLNNHHEGKYLMDLDKSEEGTVDGGQQYRYIAQNDTRTPKEQIDYLKFFNGSNMYDDNIRLSAIVPNAKVAIEIYKDIFYGRTNEDRNNKKIAYDVLYDKNNKVWIVVERFLEMVNRSPRGLAISSTNGQVVGVFFHPL